MYLKENISHDVICMETVGSESLCAHTTINNNNETKKGNVFKTHHRNICFLIQALNSYKLTEHFPILKWT